MSSDRFARYSKRSGVQEVTNKDRALIAHAQAVANGHSSGGSYNMAAVWARSKPLVTGTNKLHLPARYESTIYPRECGLHAELDLFRRSRLITGGTVYVAGALESSGSEMPNTKPCIYCATILDAAFVRWVVYRSDGEVAKARPEGIY